MRAFLCPHDGLIHTLEALDEAVQEAGAVTTKEDMESLKKYNILLFLFLNFLFLSFFSRFVLSFIVLVSFFLLFFFFLSLTFFFTDVPCMVLLPKNWIIN